MEWSELKNIILLLLASVNVLLLILVGVQESRAARYEEDTCQAAVCVLEQSSITFGPERVPQEAGLSPLTVTHDRKSEAIMAQTLLDDVFREEESDVRHRYPSARGTTEFSMNGTLSVCLQPGAWVKEHERPCENASQSCPERIDLQGTLISSESGECPGQTVPTYYQNWEDTPLFSCQVTLLWQDGTLLCMEGQRLPSTIISPSEEETLSAATVLVHFLAGMTEGGFACSRIDEMNAGYLIVNGTMRPVELTPAWCITTDSGAYYVDVITRELSPTEDWQMPFPTICVRLGHIQFIQAGVNLAPYLDEHHLIPAAEAMGRIRRDSFSASLVSKRGICGILDLTATRNKGRGAGLQ